MISKREFLFLFVCFATAVGLRFLQGNYNLIFPYDQARDVLTIKSYVDTKHLPIMGPVSDIPGVHHGPWFYYLLIPLYLVGNYDPTIPLIFFILMLSACVFPLYLLAKSLFHSRWIAATAVIFYVFSFEAVSYSRWISNPVLAIPLMIGFIYGVWRLWEGKKLGAVLSGIFLGLLTGVSLVLAHQILTVFLVLLIRKKRIREYLFFIVGGIVGSLPLVLAEMKFHFQGLQGFVQYLGERSASHSFVYQNWFGLLLRNNLFGLPILLCTLLGIVGIYFLLRQKKQPIHLLLIVSFFYFCLPFLGRTPMNFYFAGILIPIIILFAYILVQVKQKFGIAVFLFALIFTIGSQLRLYRYQTQNHEAYVQVQKGVWFSDRMQVLDAIYNRIGMDTPFSVSILETPYGVRSAWAYYFWWYGNHHGTQTPSWYGFAANGYIGDDILPHVDKPEKVHVTVYEPEFDIAPQFKDEFTAYQNEHTALIDQIEVNHHIIQFRKPKATTSK